MIVAAAPTSGWRRLARAGTIAGTSVALGAVAHWAEGGCVSTVTLAGAAVGVAAGTWMLTSGEVSGRALLLWLGLTQLFLHLALQAACAGEAGGGLHHSPVWMLPAHAAAVAGTAAVLRSAEAAVWVRVRLRRRCLRVAALVASLVAPADVLAWDRPLRRTPDRARISAVAEPVLGAGQRRGPPAALFAA